MALTLSPSQLNEFAREVAGQVSEGFSLEQIASNLDLAAHELDQVFDAEEFKTYLGTYGQNVVETFAETRAAARAGSFHRKVSERFDTYYDELHDLAMNKNLKPEKRADILMTLMKYVAPPDQGQADVVRMPPALIENWVRRTNEYYEATTEARRLFEPSSRVGNSAGSAAASEKQPILLRQHSAPDDGLDSGASPSILPVHPDESVERGATVEPEEVSLDAARALQILNRVRCLSSMAADSRPEHLDSSNLIEGSEHEEVVGGDS